MSDALSMNSVQLVINNRKILNNLSMSVPHGSAVTIMGPNGAGKTTLLRVALGLVKPTAGDLHIFGNRGFDKENRKLLGYIPQNLGLVGELSVFSNVMIGAIKRMPRWRSIAGVYTKDLVTEAYSLMYDLKVSHLMNTKVKKLSGGEKQRVAIARTLIQKPSIILADEMTASLDFKAAVAVMDIFAEIKEKMGITLLMTHHNPEIARMYSDNVLIMMNGRIEKNIQSKDLTKEAVEDLYET
ncbi:phosphonate ABC transporter ATP-binding protein [Candidatus Nitrosotenuis uzonensis]|uniref:Putative Phosphonates import ATP-binding protein PhnC n=2 Tax=Candidatus Nitrosotenuis uzonensis TaxID=1407055 RepID=V6AR15_9ARCH|nr:ATP-binding cassette domain-containing protein [Candidatus Nitrosotenuis uzonensis]CAE6504631.1 putative Phosphonates import ATP-binding protein PhnC [Candidatus Nitrosotenuis uzonensis]CDI04858.1 putative Phosphonates import ATP-binding protein PhnC [Candidatus Nitrosotenuis uzonensis]